MKKSRYILMSTLVIGVLFVGCGSEVVQSEGQEISQSGQVQIEQTANSNVNDTLDKFLAGEINAKGNGFYWAESFNISEIPLGEEWDSYSIGDRIDLDNDEEEELVLNGPYGGMYLDVIGDKIIVFASGDGTASNLSYINCDDGIWIVHSDTMHSGRTYYRMEKYSGTDNMTDCVTLECYEQGKNSSSQYYLNGNEVSESAYKEQYLFYFGE